MLPLLLAQPDDHWLDVLLLRLASSAPENSFWAEDFNLRALLALVLVSLICGAVGSLVVGGRMAFFSDALAHCAFASVSIGFVVFTTLTVHVWPQAQFWDWVTVIMLTFGVLIGYSIVTVGDRTGLAGDTVIGVFFAGAIGLAALLRKIMQSRQLFSLEDFLFGDPLLVSASELVYLGLLALLVAVVLGLIYNHLLLVGFSPSLALSRNVPGRLSRYAFVILLALIVNLCIRTVGALLINALLVVPAATAVNVARNLRQLFWWTVGLCLACCLGGQWLSWEIDSRYRLKLGIPGAIVLLSVAFFVVTALFTSRLRRRGPVAG
jgi:zinc transport system permease protein